MNFSQVVTLSYDAVLQALRLTFQGAKSANASPADASQIPARVYDSAATSLKAVK